MTRIVLWALIGCGLIAPPVAAEECLSAEAVFAAESEDAVAIWVTGPTAQAIVTLLWAADTKTPAVNRLIVTYLPNGKKVIPVIDDRVCVSSRIVPDGAWTGAWQQVSDTTLGDVPPLKSRKR